MFLILSRDFILVGQMHALHENIFFLKKKKKEKEKKN